MADAKIVDIKGVQWELKDEVARNGITTLKEEIEKLRTIEKWEYDIPIYGGKIVARRQGNVINVSGNRIGIIKGLSPSIGNIILSVLPERFRPSENCFYMMRSSGSYITQYGGIIFPNGEISYYTYTTVDYGAFSASYIAD